MRCLASPRHALLAESLGKPSLWVIISAPWYKEDLVLEHLKAANSVAAAAIGDLAAEHEDLAALTRRFAGAVDAILQDIQVPRGPFEDAARRFLESYREHMDKEERAFLPAARRSLRKADFADIEARLSHREDPLFGAPGEERFASPAPGHPVLGPGGAVGQNTGTAHNFSRKDAWTVSYFL